MAALDELLGEDARRRGERAQRLVVAAAEVRRHAEGATREQQLA